MFETVGNARIKGETLQSRLNIGCILHRLDGLTGVIWVILSKKKILQQLLLRTNVIYSFLPSFEACATQSHTISFCYVIVSVQRQMCVTVKECQYIRTHIFIILKTAKFYY